MLMHLFTPNHVQLLNSCYSTTSALLTAGPDYSPNSQELSRLTYYASNHPGKLTKLGIELEKRLRIESRKARTGNLRARASLLITLSIFRALATECRRDIALLAPSLVSSIAVTLSSVSSDLEVVARAASVFTAWTTYTDGHLIGTDSTTAVNYLSALRQFALLSSSTASDQEVRNRTRLIGFAALNGALNSEALYNDSVQFKAQVSTIIRPILSTLFQTEITVLDDQATIVKEAPPSPYLTEFRMRPAAERRAASIHIHIDGDKGPSMVDVSNASLRALFSLISHANGAQIGFIMHSSFDSLDEMQSWGESGHCCWFAQKMAEWSQYQYRYAVPIWLVERLCQNQDITVATPLLATLAAMTTTVFNSPIPLVNLSTSDIISNLSILLLRRAESDPDDLLPALVECISSLGRHVYYSDQIQDLAGELINRIAAIEVQGTFGRGSSGKSKSRTQAIRCLLAGLLGLIRAADSSEVTENRDVSTTKSSPVDSPKKDASSNLRASRRTSVAPDMWHDTLSLLCDKDYNVRADYSDALIYYLREEMSKHGEHPELGGVRRARRLVEGPIQQAVNISILLHAGNAGTKFLHAVHAYLYVLATAPSFSMTSSSSSSSSHSILGDSLQLNAVSKAPEDRDVNEEQSSRTQSPVNERGSLSTPQSSKVQKSSAVRHLLDEAPSKLSISPSAYLTDYTSILNILTAIHEEFPVRGLLTSIPMLIALNEATSTQIQDLEDAALYRIEAIKEVLAQVWLVIGSVWSLPELIRMAETALSLGPKSLPMVAPSHLPAHLPPRNVIDFPPTRTTVAPWVGMNVEDALEVITASPSVHEATGLDKEALLRRFTTKWTSDLALKDSRERSSNFDSTIRGDGITPLLKISPALAHIENISQQSLARSAKGVGVADLRGALEGRSSMSNPALVRPPSISTLEHAPSTTEGGNLRLTQTRSRPRSRKEKRSTPAGEVREVLNRLGIGRQNGDLLQASFPTLQISDQR